MRALLVDHDVAMLDSVRCAIGFDSGVVVEIATSKLQCIDLMRSAPCEILIACERLADGSGLELLSQVGRHSPATLRIFAAEPSRLALLLGGRLAPFRLYQTLAYPIDPALLLPLLVQVRAHSLESVLPSRSFRPRASAPAQPPPSSPSLAEPVVPASGPAAPRSTPQSRTGAEHRRLLIGAALIVSAALVVLGVRLQSANSVGPVSRSDVRSAPSGGRAMSPSAPINWNAPSVALLVSEVELALTRRDTGQARAALEKLRAVAPTHPRIGFFEALLREPTQTGAQPTGPTNGHSP
jgi:DNA-binding NarL/FixJ family response regulator